MKRLLLTASVIGGLGMAQTAHAAVAYTFTSSGTFSDLSGATSLSSNKIGWGGTNSHGQYNGSTMTANALSTPQTGTAPTTSDLIGSLTWYNASTDSSTTASTVTADYKLTLNFSKPTPGGSNSETFDLTITNTANNALVCFAFWCNNTGDVSDTGSLSPSTASFLVNGLRISNFSFSVVPESGVSYVNGKWTNPEGNSSTLNIYADITEVPEPASMAILGTGLLGLGLFGAARKRT